MKVVFILVDALKSNYLTAENMPFLHSLTMKGRYIKEIVPSAGFCERSEIFSGLDSYDTGNFTAIGYLPENSEYKNDNNLINVASVFDAISMKYTRFIFGKLRVRLKRRMNHYRIPFSSLKNFSLTEDGSKKLVEHDTIFDELTKANKTFTLDAFTSLSDLIQRTRESSDSFISRNVSCGIDFIPLYIGIIDSIGHKYGSDIDSIKPYLRQVDDELKRLYKIASANKYEFVVLGDHGMIPVKEKLDIKSAIDNLGLKHHKDYEVFYDSTIVRFWFYNNKAGLLIYNTLEQNYSKYGKIIDTHNYKEFRIPLDIKCKCGKAVYGDILWFANPGVLVSPDYFHKTTESENGMHGYLEVVHGEGTGLYIAVGNNVQPAKVDKKYSYEICNELCQLLEINTPNTNKWKRKVL